MTTREMFAVSSPLFALTWSSRRLSASEHDAAWAPPGRLALRSIQSGLPELTVDRCVPYASTIGSDLAATADLGPRLSEETEYLVYLKPLGDSRIRLRHDDPTLTDRLREERDGTVHGVVNFGSNVGKTDFRIEVDGRVSYVCTMEVFPTKLDYESDYESLVAEVQDITTSLALEYLRSTYRLGATDSGAASTDDLTWVLLLRHVFSDLERGLRHIANSPRREIVREEELTPVHRVRGRDPSAQRSLRQLRGTGPRVDVGYGVTARAKVWSRPPRQTLDTNEHRWLDHQLTLIRRRLSRLVTVLEGDSRELSSRRRVQLEQLAELELSAGRLAQLEPLAAATRLPPPSFASQQLMTAPGYREAYQACSILNAGLNLEGDSLRLSTKELHQLYEYWCYLTIVRLVRDILDAPLEPAQLFQVRSSGLRVDLKQGRASEICFSADQHRVRVRYNPSFGDTSMVLIPQRPDILITVERSGWPALHLVLDAKYRLDTSERYTKRYGGVGPPEEALNVLHRYRDAILEEYDDAPTRHVVLAAAMFPGRDTPDHLHETTTHWAALQRIGVGALPALPDSVSYVDRWLRQALGTGGWGLAESSIPHAAQARLAELRRLEALGMWLAEVSEEDLGSIQDSGRLVVPWTGQPGLVRADQLGLLTKRGAVVDLMIVPVTARELATPARATAADSGLVGSVILELDASQSKTKQLVNDAPLSTVTGFTSGLAASQAASVQELAFRRVEEWRLRDELDRAGLAPELEVTYVGSRRRPELRTAAEERVSYEGARGYALRRRTGETEHFVSIAEVLAAAVEAPSEST